MDSFSSLEYTERGKLVLNSGILDISWSKISELYKSSYQNKDSALEFKTYEEAKFTFVVFATEPPTSRNGSCNSTSTLVPGPKSQDPNPFQFLCSKKTPSFSLHTPTFELFASAIENLSKLRSELDSLLKSNKPVIITGAALGGSVASLFTLWLLETVKPKLKRPLCITFGSPLIGDASLQEILENSLRNSCFLHVADASQALIKVDFRPFGTFLICLGSKCICIDDPVAVTELLGCANNTNVVDWFDYGEVLDRLDQEVTADSRLMIDDIIYRMAERGAKKKLRYDQLKKLDNIKISMIYLEWYKKKSKLDKIGYYDRFKTHLANPVSPFDMDIERRKREVNDYWKTLLEEVQKKPQSKKMALKTRSLLSGNNYRRLVEPLDIAEYYLSGRREYRTSGRSRHYVMIEEWFNAIEREPVRCKDSDLSDLLMFDSCFWSEVEEVMIVIKSLKTHEGMRDEVLIGKLLWFEEYVWEMIKKREVSPEIFLESSSFMRWWKEYKEIKGKDGFLSSTSDFSEFMDTRKYERYGKPESNSRA